MKHLTWPELILLGCLLVFSIAAGAENPVLGVAGLVALAATARILVAEARPARPLTPLEQRQRESLRAGKWDA